MIDLFWGWSLHKGTRGAAWREVLRIADIVSRTGAQRMLLPWLVALALGGSLCHCAEPEPGEDPYSSLAVGTPHVGSSTNGNASTGGNMEAGDGTQSVGNDPSTTPSGNFNATASPADPTTNAQGFRGLSPVGFSLRSTDDPSLCLSASTAGFVDGSAYTLASCRNSATQLFYWSQGVLAQTPNRCLTGAFAADNTVSIAACPNAPGWGQGSLTKSPAVWLLSADTNTLYTNSPANGSYTVVPTSTLAAGNGLKTTALNGAKNVAHLVASTSAAGGVRIYINDGTKRCLSGGTSTSLLSACQAGRADQLWQLRDHTIVGSSGACLTSLAAAVSSTLAMQTCAAGNANQLWYFAGGVLGLATPYANVQSASLALDVNTTSSQPFVNYMSSTYAKWSIGALDFF